ncbi:MAG: hypothetical protein ACR2OX_03890 [Methyloligellaceae bacterium]
MTHVDAAMAQRYVMRAALIIATGFAASGLSGCSSGSTFSLSNFGKLGTEKAVAAVPKPSSAPIAFAPVFGAPPTVSQQLSGALVTAAEQQKLSVVKDKTAKPDYTVRGYLVASPDNKGTKLSYVWDVTDKAGKRAHRIKGEELVSGDKGKTPWASINKTTIDRIAAKTASQIALWLPKRGTGATTAKPVAQSATASKKSAGPKIAAATKPAQPTAAKPRLARAAPQVTGSTGKSASKPQSNGIFAIVPPIAGAPGDGKISLANALKQQLSAKGINVAASNTKARAYQVAGIVKLGSPTAGKQEISIQWRILDPSGRKLGTVSQRNSIPQGSLDGKWGPTASKAAEAAADGILKLLPKPK